MKSILKIVEDGCWSCGKPVKLPFVDNTIGPKHYKDELIKIAIQHGAVIENRFSNTRQESYNANVCPHCNTMFGEYHLVNYWYSKTIEEIEVDADLIMTEDGMLIY
jgi:hypothetical protein